MLMPLISAPIGLETLGPGAGLWTVMLTLPDCALVTVPVAVNFVEEITVVVRAILPRYAVAPGAKCAPVKERVSGPTEIDVGEALSRIGIGLFRVTALLPFFEISTVSAAVMVMVLGAGGNSGAV